MRITGLIAAPCAFGLLSMSKPIVDLLTSNYTEADLQVGSMILGLLGITVLFNSVILVTNAMMQAHGDVNTPVINMIAGGVIKVIINFVLVGIPALNIVGAAIGTMICYLVIMIMNIAAMYRKQTIDLRSLKGLFKPVLAGGLMGIVAWMANGLLSRVLGNTLGCLGGIGVAAVVYVVLVIVLQVITYDDCMLLPAGEKIAKLLRVRK